MPLVRFKIRNELSLGGSELNRSAEIESEEPKAIFGAVEVAGLIGILRQLGDLAEFSAEVFNGIQEEVTVTASRCQKMTSRVRRIESALSPLEKAVLSQTSHIHFAYTAGSEWHPRIRNGHSHFVQSELPLCVMETYEQCRDPPPLHLLDRFDLGGPGSCLRKYSDPTFFRKGLSNPSKADDIKVQRDQAHRKRKKKRLPQRSICRSRAVSTSDETNGSRLSYVTDDRQTTSQSTSTVDMPRSSNMQDLSDIIDQSHLQGQSDALEQSKAQAQSDFQESSKTRDSITGSGYIEYVISQSPVNKPEAKLTEGFLLGSLQPANIIGSAVPEGCIKVVDDNNLYNSTGDLQEPCASIVFDVKKETVESMVEKSSKVEEALEIHELKFGPGTPDRVRQNQRDFNRTYILFDEVDFVGENQRKSQTNTIDGTPGIENEGENKSEQGSEADEFVDARNTIESESESDLDGVPKPKLEHYFGDISTYCSEDANSDNNDGSEDIQYEQTVHDTSHDNSVDESYSGSYLPEDENVSCYLSEPVFGKTLSHDETFEKHKEPFAMCPSLLVEGTFLDVTVLREEPVVATHPLLAGDCVDENSSSEEPTSSGPSLEDAIPAENFLLEEHWANYPALTEAVPNEKISPADFLSKIPSLAEPVPGNTTPAEEPDTHPYFPKTVEDKKISSDARDSKNLSVPEPLLEEEIPLEEFYGIHPCLAEAVPDERLLGEEPEEPATTCLSLSNAMPIEKLVPEEPLEAYHYSTQPKENILQEKSVDSTHPSCPEAAPEENLLPEILDSTNWYVAEAVPQEQLSLEEFVDINPCLKEAVDGRFLPEEPVTTDLSLTNAMTIKKVLPEALLETCTSEELPEEKILNEEIDDSTHPSEAVSEEKILLEKYVDSTHPSCARAAPEANRSPEILDSTNLSLAEAVPQEQISLQEFYVINPCLEEAVDERFLPEEPVTTDLSLTKAMTIKKVLSEALLETCPLEELPEENILHLESDDATHPSEAVSDEKISQEVSDYTYLSLEEALPEEQISLEEFVGINPCLVEAVFDEMFSLEDPVTTCSSSTKAAAIEGILPEKPLEVYPSLAELSEDEILHEEANGTHPSLSETGRDEQISPEVLDSTNLPVEEAVPQEQISLENFVGIDPFLVEAVPDKNVFQEEHVTTCMSLTKAVRIEDVLPEEPLEAYDLEKLPKHQISAEESDEATYPSCVKGESDENVSPEALDSKYLFVAEASLEEQILLEEFAGIDPCLAETVPEERGLPVEPVTTCMSLTNPAPIENILPEEPLELYPSLEELPEEKISQVEEFDDATHPSFSEAVDYEMSSPLENGSTVSSLEDYVLHDQISHEELVGTNPFLEIAVPKERSFQDEPGVTYQSSAEVVFEEKNLPEDPLPMYPSLTEAGVPDEKISLEDPDTTYPPFAETVFNEKISGSEAPGSTTEGGPRNKTFTEEPSAMYLSLANKRSLQDEPGFRNQSLAEAVFKEKNLQEDPLPAYPSLAEAGVPDEKISLEEPDTTYPPSAVAVFDESISGSETPGSRTEAGLHNETFTEEPSAMHQSLAKAVLDENISGSEAPGSTTEASPHNETFPEEHVATNLSLAEPVPNDNILPKEPAAAYLDLAEGIPDQQVFLDDAAFLSFAEAIFDQKFSPEVPDSTYPSSTEPEPVSIWSNGGLLGLAPSKPPVFAEPKPVIEPTQNKINETNVLATKKQESSSRSVEDTEKTSLSLAVSAPTSQQHNNTISHSNGSHSHLQNAATSFKVFGLSQRLLMTGFRGLSPIQDKTQQAPGGSSFGKQLEYESSLFGSPTSSPPVEHMKISFNPIDTSLVTKLKLRIPCQPQYNGGNSDMFPSFELIPEASNSDGDEDTDIFDQSSSPCVSDNCLSDSELWESDGSSRKSLTSLKEDRDRSRYGDMSSFSGSVLDLPCFDSVDHQSTYSRQEQEQVPEYKPSVSEIIRDWPPNQT